MKTMKIITIATLAVVASALLLTTATAMGPFGYNSYTGYGGMMGRGGMMGGYGYGYGYNSPPYTTNSTAPQTQYYQPVYPFQFGGCIGRIANGLGFGGMMSRFGYAPAYTTTGTPLNVTTASTIAQNYVASTGNPDLVVKQVEEYQANYYVQVNEKSTGNGAFELLINKYTGSIYPEMGPNMMWNTKYGMMRSGALAGIYGNPTTTMTVTAAQATTDAQQYLNSYLPGTSTGDVTTFYGYYTVEVVNGTTPYGMLSVNGYSGQVWFHTWHGAFIQELDVN